VSFILDSVVRFQRYDLTFLNLKVNEIPERVITALAIRNNCYK